MDETHRNKAWLLDEIKKKRQKGRFTPDMGVVAILRNCNPDFVSRLTRDLKNQKMREYDMPTPLSKSYHWFFTDIISSSDPAVPTSQQARKIHVLNKVIAQSETFRQRTPENTLILPTGDGMAIGFSDSPEMPLRLSLEVHEALYTYNRSQRNPKEKIAIRIGLDTGPVFSVEDLNGHENVWGPGIIMARRVMDLASEMNILATSRFANDIRNLKPEYQQILHAIGDYNIKHGEKLLIYNIYGDGFGNKKEPIEDKNEKSLAAQELARTSKSYTFNSVAIELEILEKMNMLTRHRVRQSYVNISNKPIERLFFYLDGDVPREFPDCNVVVKDEQNKELEIMSLNVNKPYHKEFFVKLRKPINPGEKGRSALLEYEWDERERQFGYRFASHCKKFTIKISVPNDLQVVQKVVKVDTETGDKVYAPTPATVSYLPDRTEINWTGSNFSPYESYRFDW